jgi:hypothetical protein
MYSPRQDARQTADTQTEAIDRVDYDANAVGPQWSGALAGAPSAWGLLVCSLPMGITPDGVADGGLMNNGTEWQ